MTSYIDSNLMSNEKVVFRTKPHWIIFGNTIAMGIIFLFTIMVLPFSEIGKLSLFGYTFWCALAFLTLVISIGVTFVCYIGFMTSEFGITNKRVLIKVGFVSRRSLEVLLPRIESISVIQTIPGRILEYGTLIICGTGGSKDIFHNIPNPLTFRKIVQEQIDHYEEKR